MINAGRRFASLIGHPGNQWATRIDYSNDGGRNWVPLRYVEGSVVCSAASQIRWSIDNMIITGANVNAYELNPYRSRVRIMHGIDGVRLLPLGMYRLTGASQSSPSSVSITASSFEEAMIAAPFGVKRTLQPQDAGTLIARLIREVQPSAQVALEVPSSVVTPRLVVTDRWQTIDGQDSSTTSLARALGGRVFTTETGGWVVRPVPTLADAPVWSAQLGQVIIDPPTEQLSIDGVCNRFIVGGPEGDTELFPPQVAIDNDPLSDTYYGRSFDDGGMGPRTIIYRSELARNRDQARIMAQAGLARRLGLRQKIITSEVHDPRRRPGDVGVVQTVNGPRLVLPDTITWDLRAAAMIMDTRTTQTRLAGDVTEVPNEDDPLITSPTS